MSKRAMCGVCVALLVVLGTSVPASAQVCAPLDDGRIAEAFHEGTVIFWNPAVEFQRITLTITGPCEDIVKVFTPKDQIMFDIREIERVTDGQYNWTLRREASIDPGVQKLLDESRGSGEEDDIWWSLFQAGKIPDGPYSESGSFTVDRGQIVDPGQVEKAAVAGKARGRSSDLADAAVVGGVAGSEAAGNGGNTIATRDQVIPDDLIVQGSLCVGFDCVNNESFGFDTIRLKENNLRIKFEDTSVGSFPTTDWQIIANDSASGGQGKFSVEDFTASRVPFTIEANATTNSLYVDSTGRIGLRTSTPVLDLHISTSNTPGMRLEQTNAGGFTAQTWDIAGNEANFFVRDVTGGSRLPFRIRPGAPTSTIDIAADGDVGIGTASPDADLHILQSNTSSGLLLERAGNPVTMLFEDSTAGQVWEFKINAGGDFAVNNPSVAGGEFILSKTGSLTISGDFFSATCTSPGSPCAPDYVFAPDYELMPLDELKTFLAEKRHLPNVPSEDDLRAAGQINMSKFQLTLLEKIEELTLYTLDQEERIGALSEQVGAKDAELEELREMIRSLANE